MSGSPGPLSTAGPTELVRTEPDDADAADLLADRSALAWLRRTLTSPGRLLAYAAIAAVLLLMLYPILRTAWTSFTTDGRPTAAPFRELFALHGVKRASINTAIYVVGTTVVTVVVATFFAWINERTDGRINWAAGALPIVPLLVPVIGGVIGQVFLYSEHSGYVNVGLRSVLGSDANSGPINIFGFAGLIGITALYFIPFVYIVMAAALRNLDPALDEAARTSGAGPIRTALAVTLPAVSPALAGSALLIVVLCIANFSVPIVIGTSAGIDTLSTFVYRLFTGFPPQIHAGVGLGVLMLVVVQLVVLVQGRVSRTANRAAISARGQRAATRVELGVLRWPFRALIMLYFVVGLILPVGALLLVSLQPFWGAKVHWDLLSLDNYRTILNTPALARALTNSVVLGAVGATVGVLIATGLVFFAARGLRRGSRFVNGVLQVPATIPYTVLGVAFLVAFSSGPINLYGTRMLLLLVYVVMFLPQAASAMAAATSQLDRALTEAASVSGAGKIRTAVRIVLPQLLPAMAAAWVILFILMATEVTASALLSGVGNPVVGPVIVDFFENGTFPQLAALAVVMTLADAVVVLSMIRFVRRAYRGRLTW